MHKILKIFLLSSLWIAASSLLSTAQTDNTHGDKGAATAEDISGMYSFLGEGEFLQINMETTGMTGYISRLGDQESDRGVFLDQFFAKGSVEGHELSFTTKQLHGVWFEFKGRFNRGPGKSKAEDGYYVLRGTLKEFVEDANKKTTSRSREVEFKLLAQPQDTGDVETPARKPKK